MPAFHALPSPVAMSPGILRSRRVQATRPGRAALLRATAIAALLFAGSLGALSPAQAAGVDAAAMDPNVAPGDDFFQYANGGWVKATAIPADRGSWGPFGRLDEQVTAQVRELLERTDASTAAPDVVRAANYYRAFLDDATIEARGLAPLTDGLAAIDRIDDAGALASALGADLRADVDPLNATNFATANFLGLWVAPGLHDTSTNMAYLLQGGLSMPDREFYVADVPKMEAIRKRLVEHIVTMFTLAGISDPQPRAEAVFDLERRIAQGHATREDSEDVLKADQTWTPAEFARHAPGLDWARFLRAAGLADQPKIGIWHPGAMAAQARLVADVGLPVWRDWMRLHLLDAYARVLPKAFNDEAFAFYGTTLSGIPQQRERWKRALGATNLALGDAVGQLYVARAFPESAKARVQGMVKRIVAAFDQRIARLAWMQPATRREARAKLHTLYVGIGYPEHWQRYDGLEVRPDDAAGNLARAQLFQRAQALAKLGRPADRGEWCMLPQVVNAVNLPVQNALNFPAAILQPPFFDPAASDATNYGAIGAVIGHEISHSFDDQGAQFDSKGTLRNWWTAQDLKHFQQSSASLARQYSAYRPFPDAAVNGQQTLSENIADLAGLAAAYDAYHSLPGRTGKPKAGRGRAHAAGTRDDRDFFLAFAQSWQQVQREQALRQQLVVDGHAPPMYRAATVRNLDAWYAAFHVTSGQALYLAPRERVRVW